MFKKENNEGLNKMNRDNAIGFSIGLLAGAIIGGAVGLLYAPKSGKETRKMIKDKATEVMEVVKEKTTDFVDGVKEETGEVMDRVKDVTSEANRKGHAAIKAMKS